MVKKPLESERFKFVWLKKSVSRKRLIYHILKWERSPSKMWTVSLGHSSLAAKTFRYLLSKWVNKEAQCKQVFIHFFFQIPPPHQNSKVHLFPARKDFFVIKIEILTPNKLKQQFLQKCLEAFSSNGLFIFVHMRAGGHFVAKFRLAF